MATRPIPFARNSSHFVHIQNCLLSVLNDIKTIPGLAAKVLWVSCRLNRTGEQDSPVFVGWVEDVEAANKRITKGHHYAPIEVRFSDTHPSKLFSDCLKAPLGTVVHRDWKVHKVEKTCQRIGEKYYNESHRRSIPIKIGNVYVGTLNTAFSGDPAGKERQTKAKLVNWAQKSNSRLVKYIRTNLAYSGPRHP
jgi:hypothetical protein